MSDQRSAEDAARDLHEMRVLLYEDGWDSVGTPQDRLRVVLQRWQLTRDGNVKLTTREVELQAEVERLKEMSAACDAHSESKARQACDWLDGVCADTPANTAKHRDCVNEIVADLQERAERAEAALAEAQAQVKALYGERQAIRAALGPQPIDEWDARPLADKVAEVQKRVEEYAEHERQTHETRLQ